MRNSDETKPRAASADTENPCATRTAILEAARSRFLHYGFKKTTIDEIAADANVGKGTVYLHFASKEDILMTIVREVKKNVTAQMQAISTAICSPEDKLRRMLLAAIVTAYDAASSFAHGVELVDEMLKPKLMACGHSEREAQIALMAQALEEGIKRGEFSVIEGDTKRAAKHLMLATIAFFPPYMDPCYGGLSCRKDLEMRANAMLDFVFHGIRRHNSE